MSKQNIFIAILLTAVLLVFTAVADAASYLYWLSFASVAFSVWSGFLYAKGKWAGFIFEIASWAVYIYVCIHWFLLGELIESIIVILLAFVNMRKWIAHTPKATRTVTQNKLNKKDVFALVAFVTLISVACALVFAHVNSELPVLNAFSVSFLFATIYLTWRISVWQFASSIVTATVTLTIWIIIAVQSGYWGFAVFSIGAIFDIGTSVYSMTEWKKRR